MRSSLTTPPVFALNVPYDDPRNECEYMPIFHLKNVTLDNLGVNIQTREGERVKVVFDGTVKTISANPLLGTTVIVNHGDYFTVYTGLREVFVKSGQKVSTNQELGSVQQNVEGVPELRFRIYKQTTPLDPETWLRD